MPQPKKHRFIVEITDNTGDSIKTVGEILKNRITGAFGGNGYVNVQVKDARRVEAYNKGK